MWCVDIGATLSQVGWERLCQHTTLGYRALLALQTNNPQRCQWLKEGRLSAKTLTSSQISIQRGSHA